jgi:hypothetical protein
LRPASSRRLRVNARAGRHDDHQQPQDVRLRTGRGSWSRDHYIRPTALVAVAEWLDGPGPAQLVGIACGGQFFHRRIAAAFGPHRPKQLRQSRQLRTGDRLWDPAVRALADASWRSRTIRLTTCWHDRRRKGQPRARPSFLRLLHVGECQLIDRRIPCWCACLLPNAESRNIPPTPSSGYSRPRMRKPYRDDEQASRP